VSSRFHCGKRVGEKSRADGTGARFERMGSALDRLGISLLNGLLECREPSGAILHERCEQSADHLFDASFAKVTAEPLQVHVSRDRRGIRARWL